MALPPLAPLTSPCGLAAAIQRLPRMMHTTGWFARPRGAGNSESAALLDLVALAEQARERRRASEAEATEAEQVFARVERELSHARRAVADARRAVEEARAVEVARDIAICNLRREEDEERAAKAAAAADEAEKEEARQTAAALFAVKQMREGVLVAARAAPTSSCEGGIWANAAPTPPQHDVGSAAAGSQAASEDAVAAARHERLQGGVDADVGGKAGAGISRLPARGHAAVAAPPTAAAATAVAANGHRRRQESPVEGARAAARAVVETAEAEVVAAAERELEVRNSLVRLKIEDGARRLGAARAAVAAGGLRWEEEERGRQDARDGGWYQARKATADAAMEARRSAARKAAADSSRRGCRLRWEPGRRPAATTDAAAVDVESAVGAAVHEDPGAESAADSCPRDIVAEMVAAEARREERAAAVGQAAAKDKPVAKKADGYHARGQAESTERHATSYLSYFRRILNEGFKTACDKWYMAVAVAMVVAVALAVVVAVTSAVAADAEMEMERQTSRVMAAFDLVAALSMQLMDTEMTVAVSSMAKSVAATGILSLFGSQEFAKLKAELYLMMDAPKPFADPALWTNVVQAFVEVAAAVVIMAEAAAVTNAHAAALVALKRAALDFSEAAANAEMQKERKTGLVLGALDMVARLARKVADAEMAVACVVDPAMWSDVVKAFTGLAAEVLRMGAADAVSLLS